MYIQLISEGKAIDGVCSSSTQPQLMMSEERMNVQHTKTDQPKLMPVISLSLGLSLPMEHKLDAVIQLIVCRYCLCQIQPLKPEILSKMDSVGLHQ